MGARRKWMRVRERKAALRKERAQRLTALSETDADPSAAYSASPTSPRKPVRARDDDPFKLKELPSLIAQIAGHGKHDLRRWPFDYHGRFRGAASRLHVDIFHSII